MKTRTRSQTVLLALIIACVASTAIHYTDNTMSIDEYPQARLVTAGVVALSWFLLTPAAILGYRLYVSGRMLPAYGALAVFSLVGISTPFHYTSATFADFPWWRNLSILSDGVTGGAVLGFVLWSALIAHEWMRPGAVHPAASAG